MTSIQERVLLDVNTKLLSVDSVNWQRGQSTVPFMLSVDVCRDVRNVSLFIRSKADMEGL